LIPLKLKSRLLVTVHILGQGGQRLRSELRQTRLGGSLPATLAVRVIQEMGEDDATHMAASVSYYAVLSIFPLILALAAIMGWIVDSQNRQDELVEFILSYLPGSEEFVRESVTGVSRLREAVGVIALFGLIWSASAVFGSITRVVNRAWDVSENPPFYKNKPRQLAMAIGVGLLFFTSVALTSFVQWASTIELSGRTATELLGGQVIAVVLRLPSLIISVGIFIAIYKFLPNTKTYWRYVWVGAALAAFLFEVSKGLFIWYLENFAQFDQLYGNLASVIILMFWTYISAMILILGAEVSSEYGRIKSGVRRGELLHD
jgi:membrane protein